MTKHNHKEILSVVVLPGGAAGTSLLCLHQLGWPPGQKSQTPFHPQTGTSESGMIFVTESRVCNRLTPVLLRRRVPVMSATSTARSRDSLYLPLWTRGGRRPSPARPSRDSPTWTRRSPWQQSQFHNNAKSSASVLAQIFIFYFINFLSGCLFLSTWAKGFLH